MSDNKNAESVQDKDKGPYNPFEHRVVEKPNSDIRSLANLLKSSLGSGILAIPLAFSNSGWGVGIVGTIIIGFLCAHCVHIFVSVSRAVCILERKPLLTYAETCRAAFANGPKRVRPFANSARIISIVGMLCTYLGVCCIFTLLLADSSKQIIDYYLPLAIWPVTYYILVFLIPLCLITQIRHLKWLAPFSLTANILMMATFAICLYYVFKDPIDFEDKKIAGELARFPAFLATVIFAMEGIGVVMPVENAMKKPQHFLGCPSVLGVAMTLITVMYTVIGLFGYFRYGDVLRGSITLNLPLDDWPAICAKCFITIVIFFTYPLHFFVVIDIYTQLTEPYISKKLENVFQICSRMIIVIFCGCIAAALPMLEQIISIVGALFYSLLGLIIPCIIETVFRWNNLGRFNWVMWKNFLLILFGFFCLFSGCLVTIQDIIKILKMKTE